MKSERARQKVHKEDSMFVQQKKKGKLQATKKSTVTLTNMKQQLKVVMIT